MFQRLIFVVVACLFCLSMSSAQKFLYNPKFPQIGAYSDDGSSLENVDLFPYLPDKRAFSFHAARGKKNIDGGEKRYSYFPSRG
ncbi:unnamed protein product [Caenorhabditis angaria]|uniref:Uncharacterized protein n=1 Tax=Caenorhabditis angaria TaxID=860376 RepID=A0A9P1J3J2_9PELO|nr:unnamed protein product [Caenorhabditis angaria]